MCKYASFVLTENEVYYSRNSSSHEEIILEHKLQEGPATRPNILRVEISPNGKWADLKSWAYKVDQDILPAWFDAEKCEERTRTALAKMLHGEKWPQRLDAFLASLKKVNWYKPDGKPLKSWRLYESEKSWAAAWAAAWDAARDAAWAAAWNAAWAAAWDAARAAARDAIVKIFDLKIDKKHAKHLADRWQVWRKGYALLCDVNGVLYVYAKR